MSDGTHDTEVQEHLFGDDGGIPNNPTLPLLVYPQALDESARSAAGCKALFASNGWGGAWVNGVFAYHHYHSNAHEVLGVIEGGASLTFGGPRGTTLDVRAGDVVVIPAGVGHRNEGASADFSVVGAYPKGQESYDLRTGEAGERPEVVENIENVALPQADPLFGAAGPLARRWLR